MRAIILAAALLAPASAPAGVTIEVPAAVEVSVAPRAPVVQFGKGRLRQLIQRFRDRRRGKN